MATLAEVRAKLQEEDNAKKNRNSSFGDNASYPFWNIPEGQNATLRFLPDGDLDNTFFWVEKQNIKLKFQGVVGEHDREITISVPCVDMFDETCPILAETRPWWKDPAKEALARQYWKKKTFIYQGFVVNSPLVEEQVPENPIRRFVINPSIHEIIRNSLVNPEFEDLPTDYAGGRDFKLTKTKKGEYANYATSQWSFKTRSLSEAERAAIEQHGLFVLKEFKGRKPDKEEMEVIKAMFHDSLAGRPFDVASYGKYYRPFGSSAPGTTTENDDTHGFHGVAATPAVASLASSVEVKEEGASVSETKPKNAHEILERIKNRTIQK